MPLSKLPVSEGSRKHEVEACKDLGCSCLQTTGFRTPVCIGFMSPALATYAGLFRQAEIN